MLFNPLIPICFGIFGLFCSYLVYLQVRGANEGSGKVKEIGDEIHLGAMVFMAAEYKILSIFCAICLVALYTFLGWETALAFFQEALFVSARSLIAHLRFLVRLQINKSI